MAILSNAVESKKSHSSYGENAPKRNDNLRICKVCVCSNLLWNSSSRIASLSCILVLFVQPTLCAIGLLFNAACVGLFIGLNTHQYYRKTSLAFYLLALSLCNLAQLFLSFFVIVMPALEQVNTSD